MDDSSSRFWERLLADWVAVVVAAFALQGLWFGLVGMLTESSPDMGEGLAEISAFFFEFPLFAEGKGVPWILGILAGLFWGVKRALAAREVPSGRR